MQSPNQPKVFKMAFEENEFEIASCDKITHLIGCIKENYHFDTEQFGNKSCCFHQETNLL